MSDRECPVCHSSNLDPSFDEMDALCDTCGYVIRDFGQEVTDDLNRDSSAQNSIKQNTERQSWADTYSVSSSTEKQIATALESLEDLSEKLSLSQETRIDGAHIYGKAAKKLLTDGRKTELIISGTLHIAAQMNGEPRPLAVFARLIGSDKNQVDRFSRFLQRELSLEVPISRPTDYIPYLNQEMGCSQQDCDRARAVLEEAETNGVTSGKSPTGFAGAALYSASDVAVSQREVAYLAGVTRETIRLRLRDLEAINEGEGGVVKR